MMRLCGVVVAAVLASSGILVAHSGGTSQAASECAYWISTAPTFQVCISANGTLDFLKSGTEVIFGSTALNLTLEGHALCHTRGQYGDFEARDDWQAPTLVSQSGSKVVVRRTTADNRFTLTQTWTRNVTARSVTVTNALRANVPADGVYFVRAARTSLWSNLRPSGDWSHNSYWIRGRSLVTNWVTDAFVATDAKFGKPYAWVGTIDISGYCRAEQLVPPVTAVHGDESGFIRYSAGNMASGQTKTFTVNYQMR